MHKALRPYMTTGVALVGASAIAVAPIIPTPAEIQIPNPAESVTQVQKLTEVELTSLVSDLLTAFNTVAVAGGDTAQVLLDATGKLPGSIALLIQAGIDNPELIPNLASALVYGFFNPFPLAGTVPLPGPPDFSLLVQLFRAISPVIALLPPPLGPSGMNPGIVTEISVRVLGVLADALGVLPDPTLALPALGQAAADLPAFVTDLSGGFSALATALGISIGGGNFPLTIPNPFGPIPPTITIPIPIQGAAPFIGQAPALLLAVLGAAAEDPEDIPGLFSFVVNRLVGFPDLADPASLPALLAGPSSLLLSLTLPTVLTLAQILPPPFGGSVLDVISGGDPGLILSASLGLGTILNEFLDLLPDPVSPFPPEAMASRVADASLVPPTVPDADLGDVVDAVRRAGDVLIGAAEALPEGLRRAVQTAVSSPEFAPAMAARLVNGGIDSVQTALGGIVAAGLGNLPEELRAPVVRVGAQVDDAINNVQRTVERVVTPRPTPADGSEAQRTLVGGVEQQAQHDDPGVIRTKPRQHLINLDVSSIKALDRGAKKAQQSDVEAVGNEGGTNVKRLPSHRLGDGKIGSISVRDVIKRVTGHDRNDRGDGSDDASQAATG